MKPRLLPALLILAAMIAAPVAAHLMRPTQKLAELGPKVDLETMIPMNFGDWRVDTSTAPVLPAPDVQVALDKIYNQVLARTYVNSRGDRVMLSIAYGGDQSDAMQVHMPEGCYEGQGFVIKDRSREILDTVFGPLPVTRLVAQKDQRNEPVTYWIIIGKEVARSRWEMKLNKFRYALKGKIPEGLLVRISSITSDSGTGYLVQKQFAEVLLGALPTESRTLLSGKQ